MTSAASNDFSHLRPEVRWAAWLAAGMAAVVTLDQWHYWSTREDFSFGYLVPLFSAYVLYDRWPAIQRIFFGPAPAGRAGGRGAVALDALAVAVVLGCLLMFALGGYLRMVTGPDKDSALALALGLAGFTLAMGFLAAHDNARGQPLPVRARWALVCLLTFPALVWLISAPMLLVFESRVKVVLLHWVVNIVFSAFDMLGLMIIKEGNVLIMPNGARVGVEDACSGIRSLTACIFSGSFLAAVFLDKFWKKALLLALAMGLAFVMNVLRSLFLTLWAYGRGEGALDADFWGQPHKIQDVTGAWVVNPEFSFMTVHDATGYAVLGLTLVGLLLLLPLLNYKSKVPPGFAANGVEAASPPAVLAAARPSDAELIPENK